MFSVLFCETKSWELKLILHYLVIAECGAVAFGRRYVGHAEIGSCQAACIISDDNVNVLGTVQHVDWEFG